VPALLARAAAKANLASKPQSKKPVFHDFSRVDREYGVMPVKGLEYDRNQS
jgi:hypothetical protein